MIDWMIPFDGASAMHYYSRTVPVVVSSQTIDWHWQLWWLRPILQPHVMADHLLIEWFYWREHLILQRLGWRISMGNHCQLKWKYIILWGRFNWLHYELTTMHLSLASLRLHWVCWTGRKRRKCIHWENCNYSISTICVECEKNIIFGNAAILTWWCMTMTFVSKMLKLCRSQESMANWFRCMSVACATPSPYCTICIRTSTANTASINAHKKKCHNNWWATCWRPCSGLEIEFALATRIVCQQWWR